MSEPLQKRKPVMTINHIFVPVKLTKGMTTIQAIPFLNIKN